MKSVSVKFNPSLLKSFDGIFGKLAASLLSPPKNQPPNLQIRNILIIRPGGIGDAALLAPAIGALKMHLPEVSIDILAERRNAGVFPLVPGIRNVFLYDTPSNLIKAVCGDYDAVIDTEQWHRLSAAVARLTGAPVLIGFGTNERRSLFNHCISYSHDDYEAESFLHLLQPLGLTAAMKEGPAFLTVPDAARLDSLASLECLAGKPYVTIFPGASIRERQWGMMHFKEIASRLEPEGLGVVIVGGLEDRLQGEEIVAGSNALNLAGRTNLAGTAAIISRTSLLLTGDSGVLHLGVGLGVATVSLFGPGIAAKWAPRGERHTVLCKGLACSPCTKFGYTPACQCNARCLAEITTDEVFNAIMMQLIKINRNSLIKEKS